MSVPDLPSDADKKWRRDYRRIKTETKNKSKTNIGEMAKNVNSPEVKPIGLSPDIVSEVDDDSNISSELVSSSSF